MTGNAGDKFPSRNLGGSEPWGRSIEERIRSIEEAIHLVNSSGESQSRRTSMLADILAAQGADLAGVQGSVDENAVTVWAPYPPSEGIEVEDPEEPDDEDDFPDPDPGDPEPAPVPVTTEFVIQDEWYSGPNSPQAIQVYDGEVFVGAAGTNQIEVFDPFGNSLRLLELDTERDVLRFGISDEKIYVGQQTHVGIFDVHTGELLEEWASAVDAVSATPHEGLVYAGGSNGDLAVTAEDGEFVALWEEVSDSEIRTVAFHEDLAYILAGSSNDIHVYELDGTLYDTLPTGGGSEHRFISVDGDFLILSGGDELEYRHLAGGLVTSRAVQTLDHVVWDDQIFISHPSNGDITVLTVEENDGMDPDPLPRPDPVQEVAVIPEPVHQSWIEVDEETGQIVGEWEYVNEYWEPRPSGSGRIAVGAITAEKIDSGAVTAEKIEQAILDDIEEAKENADIALEAANGKNTIYRGPNEPTAPAGGFIEGDTWFDTSGDTTTINVWSGSAWEEESVASDFELGPGVIESVHIADDAITTPKLAAGAVTANEIAADAVTAGKIAAGSIVAGDGTIASLDAGVISTGTLDADRIGANTITGEKLIIGSVDGDRLKDDSIPGTVIQDGAITTNKVAAGAIEADKIAANAITSEKIESEAVTTNKLAAGAVVAEKIAANTIGADKIDTETLGADEGFINVLNSSTIIGAIIKTAASGKRVELDSENGIRVFNENDERVLWANNVGDLVLGGDLSLEGGTITAYGDDSVVTLSNSGLEMETRLPLKGPVIPGGEWVYNAAATETRILLGLGDGNIGVYTFAGKHDTTWNLGVSGTTPQVIRLVTTLTRAYAAVRPSNAILTLNPATGGQLGSFTAPFSVRGFDTNGTAFLMSEFTSSASDPGTLVRTNSSGSVLWTVTESSGIPAVKIVGSTVYYTVWGVNEVKAVSLSTGNSVSSGFSVDYPNYSGLDFWDDVFYLALGGSNRRVDRYSSEGDKLDPLITSTPAEGVRVSPFDGTVVVSTWDSGTAEVFFPGGFFEKSASFESSSGELKAISPNFTGGSRMDTLEVNQVLHYDANGKLDAIWPKSDFELWDRPAESGVDLNDITRPGLHWFNSAELGNNYPEQSSGVLEVISRGSPGSTVLQKFRAVSSPMEYTRSRINGSWSAWERATPGGLIELPTRQDLNTLRSPGEYYIPSPGGTANTESLHYPLNRAGIITVVSSGESNSRIVQTFTDVPTSTKTGTFQYTRSRGTSDTWWSPWVMSTASAASAISSSTDLNDIIQPGSYEQTSSSPSLALNYPESSRGTLTVVSTGASNSLIEQRYVTTGTTSVAGNEYFRTRNTLASGWSPWTLTGGDSGWRNLTLAPGITKPNHGFYPAVRRLNGVNYIRGRVQGFANNAQSTVATLPVGYRPPEATSWAGTGTGFVNTTLARVEILANSGEIVVGADRPNGGDATWVDLAGMYFM